MGIQHNVLGDRLMRQCHRFTITILTTGPLFLVSLMGGLLTNPTLGAAQTPTSTTIVDQDPRFLTRAKNLARQTAERVNGGLSFYRADPAMSGPSQSSPYVDNGNGSVTFSFTGGPPGYTTPTTETIATVWSNGSVILDYNGPVRSAVGGVQEAATPAPLTQLTPSSAPLVPPLPGETSSLPVPTIPNGPALRTTTPPALTPQPPQAGWPTPNSQATGSGIPVPFPEPGNVANQGLPPIPGASAPTVTRPSPTGGPITIQPIQQSSPLPTTQAPVSNPLQTSVLPVPSAGQIPAPPALTRTPTAPSTPVWSPSRPVVSTRPTQPTQPLPPLTSPGLNADVFLTRAKNLARQTAIQANGGLGQYRPDPLMFGPATQSPHTKNQDGSITFNFTGGPPGYQAPSVESEITVTSNNVVTINYNGPVRNP